MATLLKSQERAGLEQKLCSRAKDIGALIGGSLNDGRSTIRVFAISTLLAACGTQSPSSDGGIAPAAGADGGLTDAGYDGGILTLSSYGGTSIALTDSTVFFTDDEVGVLCVPRGGGNTALLYAKTSAFEIPSEIAVDSTAVYWTDFNGRIMKLNLVTSAITVLATPYQPQGLKLRNGRLYWASSLGSVGSILIDGSDEVAFDAGLGTVPSELDVDDLAIYVVDSEGPIGTEKILRIDLDSGVATVLADAQNYPGKIAVDEEFVYWGVGDDSGGTLLSVAKNGGPISTLASSSLAVLGIALDAGVIYFTTVARSEMDEAKEGLFALDRATQITNSLVTGLYFPTGVSVGSDGLYWGEEGKRVAKLPLPR